MAKNKVKPGAASDPKKALAELETPQVKWTAIAQVIGAFAILWVTAFMLTPYVGNWGIGVVAVLTVVAAGFGIYIIRLTQRSRAVVDIMKGATDAEGRERALQQLAQDQSGDVMKALARAQLLSQTDPAAAQKVLEEVDIGRAPAVVQDDVRSQLALMYLRNNRPRDARALTDAMRLDRQPNAKSKALYAGVMAESLARTGAPDEARKLLETYDAAEPGYAEIRPVLLRAQVFTFSAQKKRGRAQEAMQQMAALDPNLLGAFLQKGTPPDLTKIAKQVAAGAGLMKQKVQRGR